MLILETKQKKQNKKNPEQNKAGNSQGALHSGGLSWSLRRHGPSNGCHEPGSVYS